MSSTLEQIKDRVEDLSRRYRTANERRANLSGLLQAKKDELNALVEEIKAAGLDPKKLKDHRDTLKQELETQLETLDAQLTAVEEALKAYDKGTT